ncbi:MAG: Lrp/AsnC family transcriptional regulator [Pseudomonadota bacterium]
MQLDPVDIRLLSALQRDASLTNAELGERVHLSGSQVARRRAGLEAAGVIAGYRAVLDAQRLGFDFRAVARVTLNAHGGENDGDFARFLAGEDRVEAAYSVSGDADYVLQIVCRGLDDYAALIHERLLPHPNVAQVRSEIVLRTLKVGGTLPL